MGHERLGGFLAQLLAGSADIGIATMPLLAAYKTAKQQDDWKEAGFSEWIQSDPNAIRLLERVLTRVKDQLPYQQRVALIIALGGVPGE